MIAVPGSGPGRQAGGYRRSRIPAVIAVIVATARQLAVILPVILPPAYPAVHRCPPADCQLAVWPAQDAFPCPPVHPGDPRAQEFKSPADINPHLGLVSPVSAQRGRPAADGHRYAPGWCPRRFCCSWLCAPVPAPRLTRRFSRA